MRSRAGRRAIALNLALAAASLLLTFGALEGAARLVASRRSREPHTTRGSIIRYHPLLGWDKPPGARVWLHRPEYHVLLEVNTRGLRGPERDYARPPGVRRVLLLGDSFTEGYTVPEEETVRARLEARLNEGCGRYEVLNGGTLGYSTDQEYLFYQLEGQRYEPEVVVLLFFYNDLVGNVSGRQSGKPSFGVVDGRLELRHSPVPPPKDGSWTRRPEPRTLRTEPWRGSVALRLLAERTERGSPRLHRALARAGLVPPARVETLPEDFWPFGPGHREVVDEMWLRTGAILSALDAETRARGARLVVFYVPDQGEIDPRSAELTRQRYGLGPRWWKWDRVFLRLQDLCRERGLPFVAPQAVLREVEAREGPAYFREDGHWNARGHAAAAAEILRGLREAGLVRCGTAR